MHVAILICSLPLQNVHEPPLRGMSMRKVTRKRNIDRTTLNRYYKEFSRSGFENESIFQHIGYERTKIKTMIFPFKDGRRTCPAYTRS